MYYKGKKQILERHLGAFNILFFGLGNILGPQLFIMLGTLLLVSGVYGLFSIVLCAFICYLIAFLYSEVALSMPVTGIAVNSVNEGIGGFAAFLVGWSELFGNLSYAAICALGFSMFIGMPIPAAVAIVVAIMLIELKGVAQLEKIQRVLIIVIVLFFVILIAANISGANQIANVDYSLNLDSIRKVLLGMGFFFLAFTGYEDIATYSEEVKNIRKIPLVMFSTILIVSAIFILLYLTLIPGILAGSKEAISEPLLFLSQNAFGSFSIYTVAAIAVSAALTALISTLSTSSRNVLSLSEKGFIPKYFSRVGQGGTPANAIVLSAVLSILLILSRTIDIIIYACNFLYFFNVILLAFAAISLRKKRTKLDRPFKIPLFPFTAYLTIAAVFVLMFFLELKSLTLGFTWILFGFILYMLRVIGSFRLKVALLGGSVLCNVLILLILVIFSGVKDIPHIRLGLVITLVAASALSFFLFSDIEKAATLFPHKKHAGHKL